MLKAALSKPVAVVVILLGILVFAGLALTRIPVDIFPRLNLPTIYIAQPYGGMTPAQMEGFMATRYQNQMLYVSGIKDVEVKNIQGLCLVKCTFYEDTNMAQAAGEVASQVSRVLTYFPPGTVPPIVVRFDASSLPVGELVFSSPSASLGQMQDLASTRIRPLFSQIPGASAPSPFGGNERTVVIRVDPTRMKSYQLTPNEIVAAVVRNNQVSPAGAVSMGDYTVLTPSNATISKIPDFLNVPLRQGVGPTVFIRDVATVEDGTDTPVGYALINGKRSVYIPVTKSADASTMSMVSALKAKLPEMRPAALHHPAQLRVRPVGVRDPGRAQPGLRGWAGGLAHGPGGAVVSARFALFPHRYAHHPGLHSGGHSALAAHRAVYQPDDALGPLAGHRHFGGPGHGGD